MHVTPTRGQPTTAVPEARVVEGQGIEGDRHFGQTRRRQVSLIEIEALEALQRDYNVTIAPGDARREVVTRGIALNHLVGKEFRIGEVRLLGTGLCEPCTHLAELTSETVRLGLIHRGGLCAQVLSGGTIRAGDPISGEWTQSARTLAQ